MQVSVQLVSNEKGDLIPFEWEEAHSRRRLDEKEEEWIHEESKVLLENIVNSLQALVTENAQLRTRSISLKHVEAILEDTDVREWKLSIVCEPNLPKPEKVVTKSLPEPTLMTSELPDLTYLGVPFVRDACRASATLPFHPFFGLSDYLEKN